MSQVNFYAVNSLPSKVEPDSFYLVLNGGYAETYVTTATKQVKLVGNTQMTNALIGEYLDEWKATVNQVTVVEDIAARDALLANAEGYYTVLVKDATADPTVLVGSAMYVLDFAEKVWIKVSEYESMDMVIKWVDVQGKPNSSIEDIDEAVSMRHIHTNKSVLDALTKALNNGELLFENKTVKTQWLAKDW